MWNMNDVVKIEYRGGFVYRVVFDDGKSDDIDFSEYIGRGPVFEPLRNTAFFQKATIEGGTISWPNGADTAPETLYGKIGRQDVAADAGGSGRAGQCPLPGVCHYGHRCCQRNGGTGKEEGRWKEEMCLHQYRHRCRRNSQSSFPGREGSGSKGFSQKGTARPMVSGTTRTGTSGCCC